jgi:hypothetical protein
VCGQDQGEGMATDTSRLQGEIETVPVIEPTDVENLLKGLLNALITEKDLEPRQ